MLSADEYFIILQYLAPMHRIRYQFVCKNTWLAAQRSIDWHGMLEQVQLDDAKKFHVPLYQFPCEWEGRKKFLEWKSVVYQNKMAIEAIKKRQHFAMGHKNKLLIMAIMLLCAVTAMLVLFALYLDSTLSSWIFASVPFFAIVVPLYLVISGAVCVSYGHAPCGIHWIWQYGKRYLAQNCAAQTFVHCRRCFGHEDTDVMQFKVIAYLLEYVVWVPMALMLALIKVTCFTNVPIWKYMFIPVYMHWFYIFGHHIVSQAAIFAQFSKSRVIVRIGQYAMVFFGVITLLTSSILLTCKLDGAIWLQSISYTYLFSGVYIALLCGIVLLSLVEMLKPFFRVPEEPWGCSESIHCFVLAVFGCGGASIFCLPLILFAFFVPFKLDGSMASMDWVWVFSPLFFGTFATILVLSFFFFKLVKK